MENKNLTLFILILFVIGLTSCETLFVKLYGIKKIKPVSEKTILHYSKKYAIPLGDSYELDTSYISYIFSIDTVQYKAQRKNHYQPLQALYFDKDGQLQSFLINCYAPIGISNILWDGNETLSSFPPKQQAPVDSILPLNTHQKYLRPLSQTTKFSAQDYDYIIIVHWSRFMGRQSKRLIHFIQANCKLATDKKVKIIYTNNDNVFAAVDKRK